ncbi:hypothetical protein BJ742DRAFT_913584 [Cladochytrium replicatum]|nr:hypothetical protein BJ742DRAFT_913584 [Cladochytrium replicatum]
MNQREEFALGPRPRNPALPELQLGRTLLPPTNPFVRPHPPLINRISSTGGIRPFVPRRVETHLPWVGYPYDLDVKLDAMSKARSSRMTQGQVEVQDSTRTLTGDNDIMTGAAPMVGTTWMDQLCRFPTLKKAMEDKAVIYDEALCVEIFPRREEVGGIPFGFLPGALTARCIVTAFGEAYLFPDNVNEDAAVVKLGPGSDGVRCAEVSRERVGTCLRVSIGVAETRVFRVAAEKRGEKVNHEQDLNGSASGSENHVSDGPSFEDDGRRAGVVVPPTHLADRLRQLNESRNVQEVEEALDESEDLLFPAPPVIQKKPRRFRIKKIFNKLKQSVFHKLAPPHRDADSLYATEHEEERQMHEIFEALDAEDGVEVESPAIPCANIHMSFPSAIMTPEMMAKMERLYEALTMASSPMFTDHWMENLEKQKELARLRETVRALQDRATDWARQQLILESRLEAASHLPGQVRGAKEPACSAEQEPVRSGASGTSPGGLARTSDHREPPARAGLSNEFLKIQPNSKNEG